MSSPARIQGEVNAGGEEASIRHFFLQGFSSRCNAQVLLTAGILHLCITRHNTVLKGVLERAQVLPRSCKPAPTSASASVGARIVERLQRPPSVEVASELKDTFERLDDFLDTAIDTAAGRRGSRNVLSEVQNLQAVPDMEKISHRSSSTMPSTATPDSESAIDDSADSLPGILGISQDTSTFWDEDDGVPAGHPLEVLVCAIKGLEQHLHISIVAVRVLARLVLDLAWNSVERPDLLTMPIWMAGRVEQTTFEKVSDLFHDVPGRQAQIKMLSTDGQCDLGQPIAELCGSVHCLLDSPGFGAQRVHEGQSRAGKALECLAIIRQVHSDIIEYTQTAVPQDARPCNAVATRGTPQDRFKQPCHQRGWNFHTSLPASVYPVVESDSCSPRSLISI